MIKLLAGRLLPALAAVALFSSALSPLRPALKAFGAASDALAGETHVDTPSSLTPSLPSGGSVVDGLFGGSGGSETAHARVLTLVDELKQKRAKESLVPGVKLKSRVPGR